MANDELNINKKEVSKNKGVSNKSKTNSTRKNNAGSTSKNNKSEKTTPKVEKKQSITKVDSKNIVDLESNNNKQIENKTVVNEIRKNQQLNKLSFSLFEVVLLILITILSCILINNFFDKNENTDKDNNLIVDKDLKYLIEQYNFIIENYYGNIDKTQLIQNAIAGMFSSLDEYSDIIDNTSNSFSITLEGKYKGLGIVIYNDANYNIVIQQVYEDTPAYRAGLLPGDIISKFNGESLQNTLSSNLVERIKNEDEMTLTILRRIWDDISCSAFLKTGMKNIWRWGLIQMIIFTCPMQPPCVLKLWHKL